MTRLGSDKAPPQGYMNNIPELTSESESDYDLSYTLPRYATPRSNKSGTKKNPGTPDRPIKVPDPKLAGTPEEPIWISDIDGTDTETDVSNAAVRGTRKTRPSRSHAPPSSAFQHGKKPRSKSREKTPSPIKEPTVVVPVVVPPPPPQPIPAPTKREPPRSAKQTRSRSPSKLLGIRGVKSAASEETPLSTNITRAPSDKAVVPKNRPKKSWRAKTSPLPTEKLSTASIDIASLSKEEEDPTLEKELEEIALHGRSGMISGTPGAYDIEKGKNKSSSSFVPPMAPLDEDEADRSWHNPINDLKPKNKNRNRWYLLMSVIGLFAITGCLVFVLKEKNSEPEVMETEPELTQRQQAMQKIISQITDDSILSNPNTPQFKARRWLLFRDKGHSTISDERVIQRYTLACFYYSTSGDEKWKTNNWLNGDECGSKPWTGIQCSDEGEVTAIVLDNAGLSGTIPIEIGHLVNLQHLILKNNPGLFGWMPTSLGHIHTLSQIGLYKNSLSGTIPDIFEHANQIRYINLENNNMYGSIPINIQKLTKLDTLALANNKFDGIVPVTQLAKTTLKYLSLSGNGFSGMLEHSIKLMKTIEHLYLDGNKLKGPIPTEISSLTNLKSLDLGSNQFTGTVPSEIGMLLRLEFLSMERNKLQGTLPRELGLLTNLKSLNFASNELAGALPNISNMIRLVNLQLFENQLTGSIPEAVQQLQSIEIVALGSNKLDGTIPRSISRLSRTLRGLYLSDNNIQGRIPTELCTFASLEALFLDSNDLFGPIPSCIGQLSKLQQLYLFQNQLTGQIPTTFGKLQKLTGLGLENNGFNGEMPNGVCALVDEFS